MPWRTQIDRRVRKVWEIAPRGERFEVRDPREPDTEIDVWVDPDDPESVVIDPRLTT